MVSYRKPLDEDSTRLLVNGTVIAVIFHRIGPYHYVRLSALKTTQFTVLELCANDRAYPWDSVDSIGLFNRITILKTGEVSDYSSSVVTKLLWKALDAVNPKVVAVPGWSGVAARAALYWCVKHHVPSIMLSDSTRDDHPRSGWKEEIKHRLVRIASAGFVSGSLAAGYLKDLGMARDRIFEGYDVVDNAHFLSGSKIAQHKRLDLQRHYNLPARYFLVCARFIWEKNLILLLQAYASYVSSVNSLLEQNSQSHGEPWSLVLVGDGPLKAEIVSLIAELRLSQHIVLPGFKQYPELPAFYGLAQALILPSVSETWGLVVNEAMAAGLPVLVSNRCGCVPDLVREGINGFTFNPFDRDQLTNLMLRLSSHRTASNEPNVCLGSMGSASISIISNWSPKRFADALAAAAEIALTFPLPRVCIADRLLLRLLLLRPREVTAK